MLGSTTRYHHFAPSPEIVRFNHFPPWRYQVGAALQRGFRRRLFCSTVHLTFADKLCQHEKLTEVCSNFDKLEAWSLHWKANSRANGRLRYDCADGFYYETL